MLLKELVKFSTQHRTFYCYLLLSLWIFLLIAGMYKYMGHKSQYLNYHFSQNILKDKQQRDKVEQEQKQQKQTSVKPAEAIPTTFTLSSAPDYENFDIYQRRCTPLESIQHIDDGGILDGWKLQGVLLIIRHGDRGPMSHLRTIPSLNCGQMNRNYLVNIYRSFLYNSTTMSGSKHMSWNKIGSFHGFPLLPINEKACLLGQLTFKGIGQLLQLGDVLRHIYSIPLGLWHKHNTNQIFKQNNKQKQTINTTPYSQILLSEEVVVYTTRVRRTFQSALAFLYTFLPSDKWLSLNIKESHSIAFCFSDCVCPKADDLKKRLKILQKEQLIENSMVVNVTQWIGLNLLPYEIMTTETNTINDLDHQDVIDATLMILCHNIKWPCQSNFNNTIKLNSNSEENILSTTTAASLAHQKDNELHLNDFINIDQNDDQVENSINYLFGKMSPSSSPLPSSLSHKVLHRARTVTTETSTMGCIQSKQVAALMSFATWQSEQIAHHTLYKSMGLLRAYGMIRHIVSNMLRMISGDRTKFVLYSGHDSTLQYLTAALGIRSVNNTFVPYASRLAIEVYKSETHIDYYFRLVYNGKDVTRHVNFCEGSKSLRITRNSRGNKADLCPIENIIRFLHDDYFSKLNVTNFKDACIVTQKEHKNS